MKIEMLNDKATQKEVISKLNEIIEAINSRKERDYGPKSENPMTEEMAWRIRYGDLKSAKVKDIADEFGFSRGQIYSVRSDYTFTYVKEDDFEVASIDDQLAEALQQ